jgi:8-oxo-dGTP diphosphatase
MIDVVAWIHVCERRLLVVKSRGKDSFYLPGGKREIGEPDTITLTREIHEELRVTIQPDSVDPVITLIGAAHGQPAGTLVRMACYAAQCIGVIRVGAEIEEYAWISADQKEGCAPLVKQVLQFLLSNDQID